MGLGMDFVGSRQRAGRHGFTGWVYFLFGLGGVCCFFSAAGGWAWIGQRRCSLGASDIDWME